MAAKQRVFVYYEGTQIEAFLHSRAKVQLEVGGFGSGKTAAACHKALRIAQLYPGSNGLVARATYPKLKDSILKEFLKWMPSDWSAGFNKTDMVQKLKNGTSIDFRYLHQRGQGVDQTSNLLSNTYDWIVVDQVDDTEIVHKDFLDLLGRLRGNTPIDASAIRDDEPSWPVEGPRMLMMTCNPTRNWVYRELAQPLIVWDKTQRATPKLLLDEESGAPIIEMFTTKSEDNIENTGADFVKTLKTAYSKRAQQRYLNASWEGYEGRVYPDFDMIMHVLPQEEIWAYARALAPEFNLTWFEGYDHGIAKPACYGLWFGDHLGNCFLLDGVYGAELGIKRISKAIRSIRAEYGLDGGEVKADPSIFKRAGDVGDTVAQQFLLQNITMSPGDNNIANGIEKCSVYMEVEMLHKHPITGNYGSPYMFVSADLQWFIDEVTDYYWKKDGSGEATDIPVDKNDHAMDMMKYAFTSRPRFAKKRARPQLLLPHVSTWREQEDGLNGVRDKQQWRHS